MRNFISKEQNSKDNYLDYKVKDYLFKYLKELQRHFNITDRRMRILLYQVYRDLRPFDFIKKIIYTKTCILNFLKKEIKWK